MFLHKIITVERLQGRTKLHKIHLQQFADIRGKNLKSPCIYKQEIFSLDKQGNRIII